MTKPLGGIRIENLRKVYGHGDTAVEALKNVNMQVAPGEVVGLVFDGNIHSHGGAFWSDPVLNRTVGVTSGGMLEALKSIYGATELINEIQGK